MCFLTWIQNPGGPGLWPSAAQFLPNMQNSPHLCVSVVSVMKDQLTKVLKKERAQGM